MKKNLKKNLYNKECWDTVVETPEEYEESIRNSKTDNERCFYEQIRYKVLNETAASNDVFLFEDDNEDHLFFYRCGHDDFMIGRYPDEDYPMCEYAGLFGALEHDLYPQLGRHITLLQWLRDRDFRGVRYDCNYDLR